MSDNEVRLIDANALCEEFKKRQRAALRWKEKAILDDDEEIKIRADAVLTFLSEVKLTIDNAPTADDWENYSTRLWKEAYEQGKADRPQGEWIETEWQTEIFDTLFKCSICEGQSIEVGDYCPWCGAKMKGGEEE